MTKSGSDYLKRQAREIANATGRRFPDVLAELRRVPRTAPRQPSKELVLVCNGMAHPIDGGRCARAAGHQSLDGGWGWCSWGPNDAVNVWAGYYDAQSQAQREQEDARRAALTPEERAAEDAESEAAYWADMADAAREPYDPYDDKYQEMVWEAQDEERGEAEADRDDVGAPYVVSYLEA
ncbi:hypothetical protein FE633_12875 [Streptomyces montanus]|uniref:Uncharacterized protein n=1 Tax=Streptomyces montanus TaxID=2580423 RepID=A0A5R9FXY2_9ACTN|nr:hypothetical protein [Streptomyces montanus]TLS45663.1 hypothetical protein FE633_12875 [Streptomyces montanus]